MNICIYTSPTLGQKGSLVEGVSSDVRIPTTVDDSNGQLIPTRYGELASFVMISILS